MSYNLRQSDPPGTQPSGRTHNSMSCKLRPTWCTIFWYDTPSHKLQTKTYPVNNLLVVELLRHLPFLRAVGQRAHTAEAKHRARFAVGPFTARALISPQRFYFLLV